MCASDGDLCRRDGVSIIFLHHLLAIRSVKARRGYFARCDTLVERLSARHVRIARPGRRRENCGSGSMKCRDPNSHMPAVPVHVTQWILGAEWIVMCQGH